MAARDLAESASAALRSGRIEEAERWATEALKQNPAEVEALVTLGFCAMTAGRPDALAYFRRAVELQPQRADLHYNVGLASLHLGQLTQAAAEFQAAATLAPLVAVFRFSLGDALQAQGKTAEAFVQYRLALQAEPGSADAHVRLAHAISEEGDPDEVESLLRRAIALDPQSSGAHELLGYRLQDRGRFEEAESELRESLEQRPDEAGPYVAIVNHKRITEADHPLIDRIGKMVAEPGRDTEDVRFLHYALGKANDDLGHYEQAIRHFDEANRLSEQALIAARGPFNPAHHRARYDLMIQTFTKDFFERNRSLGLDSELPVFVLGMIRSGTTLAEQILSSHPQIGAAGELTFWLKEARGVMREITDRSLNKDHAVELAENYRRLIRSLAPKMKRVTDKMPANYIVLGLIHLLFPKARIIQFSRAPIDNALSIYVTPYKLGPEYAHNRENIVFTFKEYARIMAHWRAVIPEDRLLEVSYEDLVADREAVTRRMIEFCGVEWSDDCLSHERNDRAVKTPSRWQVRQPIYKSSVERWRHYEPWLGAFRELL